MVVIKEKIYSPHLRTNDRDFYRYFVRQLIQHDGEIMTGNASIKIDGSGNKQFKKEFCKYLKENLEEDKIKNVKFVDSKTDNLIQLADMLVGAIARSYNHNRKDNNRWRIILKSKINNIWEFS